jgi:hypothetical protein
MLNGRTLKSDCHPAARQKHHLHLNYPCASLPPLTHALEAIYCELVNFVLCIIVLVKEAICSLLTATPRCKLLRFDKLLFNEFKRPNAQDLEHVRGNVQVYQK